MSYFSNLNKSKNAKRIFKQFQIYLVKPSYSKYLYSRRKVTVLWKSRQKTHSWEKWKNYSHWNFFLSNQLFNHFYLYKKRSLNEIFVKKEWANFRNFHTRVVKREFHCHENFFPSNQFRVHKFLKWKSYFHVTEFL